MVELQKPEQRTLLALETLGGKVNVSRIVETSGLAHAAVMRVALSLKKKKFIKLYSRKRTIIALNEEGRYHARIMLPERRLIVSLINLGGEASIEAVVKRTRLENEFLPIALGWLKRKDWAIIGKSRLKQKTLEKPKIGDDERLLSLLEKRKFVIVESLDKALQKAVFTLKKRRLIKINEKKIWKMELTEAGWGLIKQGIEVVEEVTQLTPGLIRSGEWRQVKIKRFDVTTPGPVMQLGKLHPVQLMIQEIREIFLEMGFTEIRGPIIENAFWNFDVLFQPQDHPAREMHDTFYLKNPKEGKLPERSIVDAVARTHTNGWTTGSTGWGYAWDPDEAKRLILRTHTTSATIRYLAGHRDPPVKAFSVDRIYRNEKLDYKHLAELHQIEGVIMDKNVTLRDLIGTLREFYLKLGLKKVKFWPSYFPYTEPSVQSTVYVPKLKSWMELCGMGIFRPEVLEPLRIKHPVLAWGGGLERLVMLRLNVDDIRLLYKNDLGWIRRSPLICR